ncbi:thioredoxin family protein [Exiguobacterium sp. 17-1]|uniref:thioredoxin family protein n=1 Tax=Exiguobacterium sp. 17-1 TaxID=2931981 RepID=UPI001FFE40C2|nr:thioredoxin family protein [Exiguobacterium sp. 17-1]MCK2157068.1 thioredoxin family protein [Exiguobacterium sp. 17-1]
MTTFQELTSIEDVRDFYLQQSASFIYISSPGCGVCASLFPQIEPIIANHPEFRSGHVDLSTVPEIVGEFSVFTAPSLLFFVQGKELHRESRIVPIEPFTRKVEQLSRLVASMN